MEGLRGDSADYLRRLRAPLVLSKGVHYLGLFLVDEISEFIDRGSSNEASLHGFLVALMFYADGIILMRDSRDGLQRHMGALEDFYTHKVLQLFGGRLHEHRHSFFYVARITDRLIRGYVAFHQSQSHFRSLTQRGGSSTP